MLKASSGRGFRARTEGWRVSEHPFVAQALGAPRLTREEETALVSAYRAGDRRAGRRLVAHTLRVALWAVMSRAWPLSEAMFEDLYQEGAAALQVSLETWKTDVCSFATWSRFRVGDAVVKYWLANRSQVKRSDCVSLDDVGDIADTYAKESDVPLVVQLRRYADDIQSEGRSNAPRCMRVAADRLEADARALWAYRVIGTSYLTKGLCRGEWLISDASAIAAADVVWTELSAEAREKIGARP